MQQLHQTINVPISQIHFTVQRQIFASMQYAAKAKRNVQIKVQLRLRWNQAVFVMTNLPILMVNALNKIQLNVAPTPISGQSLEKIVSIDEQHNL